MICIILLIMLSCQSTNYYEVAGIKNELFTRRKGTTINDFINSGAIDRAFNIDSEKKVKEEEKEKEVIHMGEGEIVTMITSIIAGLYAIIKTIINLIKKFKK